MAVKKTTKAKPATKTKAVTKAKPAAKAASKETKVTKSVKATKVTPKKDTLKSLEIHILVILAIVAFSFLLFALGMAAGAAITIN